ncbi:MAG: hypothetical protein LBJ08_02850, partial [Bifidobacteriaceae bacterium]|nr:hypothetical protein [Bifidobacteriaceae bacterium]
MMSVHRRARITLTVLTSLALAVVALPPAALAVAIPGQVSLTKPSSLGVVKAVPTKVVWGGAAGSAVKAGRTVTARLARASGVPSSSRSLLVQVNVSGAKKPGTLWLGIPGESATVPTMAFPKGSSSTSALVRVSGARKATVRSSAAARVQIAVSGSVTGLPTQLPGPGGTQAIAPVPVVDSAASLGGNVPAKGKTAAVSVLGMGAVPTTGVRAVWVSVQTLGKGAGSVVFSRDDGVASTAGTAAIARGRWVTSLVLAPVSGAGRVAYRPSASLTQVRLAVVGWMAEAGTESSVGTISGGVVPVGAKAAKVSLRSGIASATVTGGSVPARAKQVLVRAVVTTGKAGGAVRAGVSAAKARKARAGVWVPARATSQVLVVAPVGANGKVFFALPAAAKVSGVAVSGFVAAPVSRKADTRVPTVTFALVNGGKTVTAALTLRVALSGTVADTGSGVRSVVVSAGGTVLGQAAVDWSGRSGRWVLETGLPPGTSSLTAKAADWAGRSAKAAAKITVAAPAAGDVVLNPDTHVLAAGEQSRVVGYDGSVVLLAGTSLGEFEVGQVIVSSPTAVAPDGFMRRITALADTGGQLVVSTQPATLEETLLQANLELTDYVLHDAPFQEGAIAADPAGEAASPVPGPEGARSVQARGVVAGPGAASATGQAAASRTTGPQVAEPQASASQAAEPTGAKGDESPRNAAARLPVVQGGVNWDASKAEPKTYPKTWDLGHGATAAVAATIRTAVDVKIRIVWPEWNIFGASIETFSVQFKPRVDIGATLKTEFSSGVSLEPAFLPEFKLGPFFLGPVPVTVSLAPVLKGSVEVAKPIVFSAKLSGGLKVGPTYSNGRWGPAFDKDSTVSFDVSPEPPKLKFTAAAGLEFALKIVDFAGPYVSATVDITAAVDPLDNCANLKIDWGFGARIGAKAEFKVDILGVSLGFTLADWSTSLGEQRWPLYENKWPKECTSQTPTPTPTPPTPTPPPTTTPDTPVSYPTDPPGGFADPKLAQCIQNQYPGRALDTIDDLSCRDQGITSIVGIDRLTNLQELDLHLNLISSLTGVTFPANLQKLDLNANQISSLTGITFPTNLQELGLTNNQISSLTGITFPTNLQELGLTSNQISSLTGITFPANL